MRQRAELITQEDVEREMPREEGGRLLSVGRFCEAKKICWIHTDYSVVDVNVEQELPVWSAFDHVMSISPDVTKTFVQVFPSLNDKIVEMENILSPTFVRNRSNEFDAMPELASWHGVNCKVVNILSIGRFCTQKNFDNVPRICRQVNYLLTKSKTKNNEKIEVKWFLIGYGGDEELIRKKIAEAGGEKNVKFIESIKKNEKPPIQIKNR